MPVLDLLGGGVLEHSTWDGTTGPVDNSTRELPVTRSGMGAACGERGLVIVGHSGHNRQRASRRPQARMFRHRRV
jgi:hypothetical protein